MTLSRLRCALLLQYIRMFTLELPPGCLCKSAQNGPGKLGDISRN